LPEESDEDFGIPALTQEEMKDMDERQIEEAEKTRKEKIIFAKQLEKDKKDNRLLWMIN